MDETPRTMIGIRHTGETGCPSRDCDGSTCVAGTEGQFKILRIEGGGMDER
jgi:hypothetical protein